MPKETTVSPRADKGRAVERPPSRNATTATMTPSFQQLKHIIETMPGIIKNAEDTTQHLVKKQWLTPQQSNTTTQLAAILLSIVSAHGPRNSSDKLSKNTTNTIKAVTFILEEISAAQHAQKSTSQLTPFTTHQSPAQADNASMNHIKESLDNINKKNARPNRTCPKNH